MSDPAPLSDSRRTVALFPLNVVLFPGMRLPLHIFEPRYREMMARCLAGDLEFGVVLIRSGEEVGGPAEPFEVGTLTRLSNVTQMPDGRFTLIAEGTERFRVVDIAAREPFLTGIVEILPEDHPERAELEGVVAEVERLFRHYWDVLMQIAGRPAAAVSLASEPAGLAYQVAVTLQIERREKQVLLEIESTEERLREEIAILRNQVQVLQRLVQERGDRGGETAPGFRFSDN